MGKILSLFGGGIWGYLIAGAISALLVAPATFWIAHNIYEVQIAQLKTDAANQKAANATAALTQLTSFIDHMHTAEVNYQGSLANIEAWLAAIKKGLHYAKPLPVDCKPDADRVRGLHSAISAANGADTGPAPVPVPAVRDDH